MSIVQVIENLVASCDWRRLTSVDDEPIFCGPLVGFADGDDPLFSEYERIIEDFHFTPREILREHFPEWDDQNDSCGVVCWVLPIARALSKPKELAGKLPFLNRSLEMAADSDPPKYG